MSAGRWFSSARAANLASREGGAAQGFSSAAAAERIAPAISSAAIDRHETGRRIGRCSMKFPGRRGPPVESPRNGADLWPIHRTARMPEPRE
jgi:hypothetical protein